MNKLPAARNENLVIQNLKEEVLIYDLDTNKAYCLNQTAAFVWQHSDGQTPVKQIAYLLQKKLKTPVDEAVVWFALENLAKDGLMRQEISAPAIFAGMNRRQLITTLGKSAAVAIPMVFAITAPTAAHAQSANAAPRNLVNGSTCTSGAQCASQACSVGKFTCCSSGNGGPCRNVNDCCIPGEACINGICQGGAGGGGGGCVLYDTPLTLADGRTVKAIDVFVGQELVGVNCFNGEMIAGRVKHKQELQTAEIYSILSESGDAVQCSPSHPLIAGFGDRDGTRVENFQVGDALLVYDRATNRVVEAKTTAVERIAAAQPVILFEMDTFEHTFVSGGIVSHNKIAI